jgi:hypothetical protein
MQFACDLLYLIEMPQLSFLPCLQAPNDGPASDTRRIPKDLVAESQQRQIRNLQDSHKDKHVKP